MEKVRICFTSTALNAYSETFIRTIKSSLEATVFHCYGDLFPYISEDKKLQSYKTPPFIDLVKTRVGFLNRPLREYYLIRYLKAQRINLVFANYGPSGAALAPIAEELNIPLIVHFHGYDASIFAVLEKHQAAYKRMFSIAKAIIVVSEEMKRDLITMGADERKLFKIIYSPSPLFHKVAPNYQSSQVLAIGRFVEKKAPYLTLLAFRKAKEICPELKLKFVGSGELLTVCQDLCSSMEIGDVSFEGVLAPEEIAEEMNRSFCFIQHSKQASNGDKEGTPVAILEAMAAGLPVISTLHAGIPEVVIDGANGYLVEEEDVQGMSDRLVELCQNRNKAYEFGEMGRKLVSKGYNAKAYKESLNSLIISCSSVE